MNERFVFWTVMLCSVVG